MVSAEPARASFDVDLASDGQLVQAARRGSAAAFTQIYHRYAGTVRGTLLAHMPRQDVPDALQEVFIAAWQRLRDLRRADAFGGWLLAIARNTARQYFRRRVDASPPPEDTPVPVSAAFEWLSALQCLPPAYRETMMLRFVEGMTGPEIAARTGLSPGSVRVNLHRGVRLLRDQLSMPQRRSDD